MREEAAITINGARLTDTESMTVRVAIDTLANVLAEGLGLTGDWLHNPFDARSVDWSPFAEIERPAYTDRLAESMIPDQEGRERGWFVYSQTLVSAVLKRLWEQRARSSDQWIDVARAHFLRSS
jgi:hypothetical protein